MSSGQARLTEYPTGLINAFQAACVGSAKSFLKPSPTTFECREFLPPETTAAIILNFNGTSEDLPELVIRFETEDLSLGFLVTNDVFLNVPQKTGDTIQVRMQDSDLQRTFDALYTRAGTRQSFDAPLLLLNLFGINLRHSVQL
ncbi:MAG: hypothetical protein GDA40_11120 [Rhodobacteraceae bacterium]|nr:hypothetical protein [Paracoccaceae bacterium]